MIYFACFLSGIAATVILQKLLVSHVMLDLTSAMRKQKMEKEAAKQLRGIHRVIEWIGSPDNIFEMFARESDKGHFKQNGEKIPVTVVWEHVRRAKSSGLVDYRGDTILFPADL